ncbi:MFS transporter [Bryobacter aggregatus]|uniref:MFS transporter n=1 Tax=Bryobacter aggregatus TaxID=360054 RepID=UPI0004E0F00E|nr:MFS transporter [Bryobacter aggregatus]
MNTNRRSLFNGSCMALIATAFCFAIRGDIFDAQTAEFALSNEQVGWTASTAFWGFTVAMLIGGPLCDRIGMKPLLSSAFLLHLVGILGTIAAQGFTSLYAATLAIGIANGLVEAAVNPLAATLYPEQKVQKLNLLHLWFPGGIVIGGLLCWAMSEAGMGWRIKTAMILVPTVIYAVMLFRLPFPRTEAVEHGVPFREIYAEALRPIFLLFFGCMILTAATELAPNQWVPSILSKTTGLPGIALLVWISGIMAVGRASCEWVFERISSLQLMMGSTLLAGIGLYSLSMASGAVATLAASALFALGVTFLWPTMLGITAERFPKGGGFLLALMGGVGMLSNSFAVPLIGRVYDQSGPAAALRTVTALPVIVCIIFTLLWISERKPKLIQHA